MPSKKRKNEDETWLKHDTYKPGASTSRITTRSQTAFVRIKNSDSDLELFTDLSRHHPPKRRHLLATMKGEYGNIPRTIITRSTASFLSETKELCDSLEDYKKFKPPETQETEQAATATKPSQPAEYEPKPPATTGANEPKQPPIPGVNATTGQNQAASETKPATLGETGPTLSQPDVTEQPPKDQPAEEKTDGSQKQLKTADVPFYVHLDKRDV